MSNCGAVRSVYGGRKNRAKSLVLKQSLGWGYYKVSLWKNWRGKTKHVHGLVLEAFCGARQDGMEASHLNGNRLDNRIENLRWCSHAENESHKAQHGTRLRGEDFKQSKLTDQAVREIRSQHRKGVTTNTMFAKRHGVTLNIIRKVLNGTAWKHVTADKQDKESKQ